MTYQFSGQRNTGKINQYIYISALTAGGTPQKIIQAWITGEFLVVMNTELRQEINTVFNRSKFIKPDKKRRMLLGALFNQDLILRVSRYSSRVSFAKDSKLSRRVRMSYCFTNPVQVLTHTSLLLRHFLELQIESKVSDS